MAPLEPSVLASLRSGKQTTLELWGVGLQLNDASQLASALKANGTLTALEIGGNKALGDPGVSTLAPGLREVRALRVLGLDGVAMGDTGGKELAAALRAGLPLTCLKLQHNCLSEATALAIAAAMHSAAEENEQRKLPLRTLLLHLNMSLIHL